MATWVDTDDSGLPLKPSDLGAGPRGHWRHKWPCGRRRRWPRWVAWRPPFGAPQGSALVGHDPQEPRLWVVPVAQLIELPPCFHRRLLDDVFRRVGITQHHTRESVR